MSDDTAAKTRSDAQPPDQAERAPIAKSDGLKALEPPLPVAVAPAKTAATKPLVGPAAKPIRAAKPPKPALVRNRERQGPSVGGGAAAAAAGTAGSSLSIGDWNSLVSAQIRRNQRYPESARSRGEAGVANVAFSVARSGAIGAARLAASSGYPDLDAEALAAVRRSNPLPPPPGTIGAPVARNVPIRFDLR